MPPIPARAAPADPAAPLPAVLVVDDDPDSLAYLTAAFEGLGCRSAGTRDAGEALHLLGEHPPDLVVSDFMMPGMDGLEFLDLAHAHLPGVPLVLVSACDRPELMADARQRGAVACLRKPVSLQQLAATLADLLGPGRPPAPPRPAPAGSPPLAPALLRKTSQLSHLTQFLSALTPPWAAAGRTAAWALDPGLERGLGVVLHALAARQAALVLADEGGIEPVQVVGEEVGDGLPLTQIARHLEASLARQPWCGLAEGIPVAAAPLVIQGGGVGFLCAARPPAAAPFTWADAELVGAFATQTAMALENACFSRELARSCQETVVSLIAALEARHKYTEGHSLRVSEYSLGIAETLGLPAGLREQIGTAAALHDLGKVGVRDAILDKPGPLTREEWLAMREHATLGARMLAPLRFLAEEARIVRHHHERLDGSGYPDGLAGEAIPLGARIVAVADAYDAMCTLRPYRPAIPPEEAASELERAAGSQLDRAAVAAFRAWRAGRVPAAA